MSEAKYNYECCEWDKDYAREYIEELKQQNKELIEFVEKCIHMNTSTVMHEREQLLRKHTEEVKG